MDISTIVYSLNGVSMKYFAYAIILNTVVALFGSMSYQLMFKMQKEHLKLMDSFIILHLSQIVNFLGPFKTGAIFGKPLVTKLISKLPLTKCISAVGFENFFSISWQLIMLPIILLLMGENAIFNNIILKIIIIGIFFIMTGIASYQYKWFLPKIFKLKRFISEKIKGIARKSGLNEAVINDFIESIPSYFDNKKAIAMLILLTIVQVVLLPLFVGLSLMFLNVEISYFDMFLVYWISYILGRLSLLPSGLGIKDVTMGGLLISFGVDNITAIKSVVIFRVFTLVPYLFIGGLIFLYYGHKYTYKKLIRPDLETNSKN